MRLSKLFTKVRRNAPKDETAESAKLLARAGFVYKNSAGVYTYLPLGWRVIQKLVRIIREEMDGIGGQELLLPALVEKKYLDATGRWDVGVGYEVRGKGEAKPNFALGWTHEEVLAAIASEYAGSYHDLPFAAYQIQTKFRNEPRAKSGILRGREFMMKDLYSFHASEEDLMDYYERVAQAYHRIFRRAGLEALYALAPGGDFTLSHTHEFQVPAEIGEDAVLYCVACRYAENAEIAGMKSGGKCPKCGGKAEEAKSIEVGNIFPLGTKYSEAFNLKFTDKDGSKKPVVMGSYGIGVGRLMGTIAEVHRDERGILWPKEAAPFAVHLISLDRDDAAIREKAEKIYEALREAGVEALYDDRDISAGEKFAEADLIGIPWRFVVSRKAGEKIEVKKRGEKEAALVESNAVSKLIA